MAADPVAAPRPERRELYWCPNCEEAQLPDKVGTAVCEACGATITTYGTEAEIPEAERVY